MRKLLWMGALCALAFVGCKDDKEPDTSTTDTAAVSYTGLVLNEICGNDNTTEGHEDWIELYNASDAAISLEGAVLIKTDEDGVSETIYTFAAGITIASKAYLVKEKGTDFTQGISNSKNVAITLQSPAGTDIDKFDKATAFGDNGSHEKGGSYARIPDGTGAWTVVATATKGAANSNATTDEDDDEKDEDDVDYTGLVLNEVCGDDGTGSKANEDWIELYNNSEAAISLDGVKLIKTDEDGISEELCTFEEGSSIEPSSYVVKVRNIDFTAGISNDKNVIITLQSPAGNTIDVFDKAKTFGDDGQHATGGSYSRIPNGTGDWTVVKTASKGAANIANTEEEDPEVNPTVDYTVLKLNELNGNDKYIELYNTSNAELDLTGVYIVKDDDEEDPVYRGVSEVTVPAKGFLTLWSEKASGTHAENIIFSSGLSANKSVKIVLYSPTGILLDEFINPKTDSSAKWGKTGTYDAETKGYSFGRKTDGTGDWHLMTPTQGTTNSGATAYDSITWTWEE